MAKRSIYKQFDKTIKGQLLAVDSSGVGKLVDFVTLKNTSDPEDNKIYFLIMGVFLPESCLEGVKNTIKEIGEQNYPGVEVEMIENGRVLSPVDCLLKDYNK